MATSQPGQMATQGKQFVSRSNIDSGSETRPASAANGEPNGQALSDEGKFRPANQGKAKPRSDTTKRAQQIDWSCGFTLGTKPIQCVYSQNYDFAGFGPLQTAVYDQLKEIDPRIEDELP